MASDPEFHALIKSLRGGSREAAETLFRSYGHHVLRIVRSRISRKLRQRFESEDFTQSVWKSFLAIPSEDCDFDDAAALVGYLANMARNKIVDAMRDGRMPSQPDQHRERSLDGSAAYMLQHLFDPDPEPCEFAIAEEEWDRLIDIAGPHQRQILVALRRGTTHAEIAEKLGLNPKTVQRLVQRLIQRLRERGTKI